MSYLVNDVQADGARHLVYVGVVHLGASGVGEVRSKMPPSTVYSVDSTLYPVQAKHGE